MGTKEIEQVLITACSELGIVPVSRVFTPEDYYDGVDERIVIHVKQQRRAPIFYRGFVEVNAVVPDIEGRQNHRRVQEIEEILCDAFRHDHVGDFSGETYRYGLESIQVLSEPDAHYHYVNARLLFETLNI